MRRAMIVSIGAMCFSAVSPCNAELRIAVVPTDVSVGGEYRSDPMGQIIIPQGNGQPDAWTMNNVEWKSPASEYWFDYAIVATVLDGAAPGIREVSGGIRSSTFINPLQSATISLSHQLSQSPVNFAAAATSDAGTLSFSDAGYGQWIHTISPIRYDPDTMAAGRRFTLGTGRWAYRPPIPELRFDGWLNFLPSSAQWNEAGAMNSGTGRVGAWGLNINSDLIAGATVRIRLLASADTTAPQVEVQAKPNNSNPSGATTFAIPQSSAVVNFASSAQNAVVAIGLDLDAPASKIQELLNIGTLLPVTDPTLLSLGNYDGMCIREFVSVHKMDVSVGNLPINAIGVAVIPEPVAILPCGLLLMLTGRRARFRSL